MSKGVVVTGGAGFLGLEICRGLIASGYGVLAIDVNLPKLTDLVSEIEEGSLEVLRIDLTDRQELFETLENHRSKFDRFVGLVNCAAYRGTDRQAVHQNFDDYDINTWSKMLDVNLTGTFSAIQAFKRCVLGSNSGSIVNVASVYGSLGTDQRIYDQVNQKTGERWNNPAAYTVSKGGIIALTKYLATLWGKDDIRVNCVSPGGIWREEMHDQFVLDYSKQIPLNRMADVSSVVEAIVYLISDKSKYITGHNLIVDGGLSAW